MALFKDNKGRSWVVEVTAATFKRVKSLLGFDLASLAENRWQGLMELANDPVRLVDVLYCVCKPEADRRDVTDEDFGEAMAGDAVMHAAEAFAEEYINFTPDPRTRVQLRRIWEAQTELRRNLQTRTSLKLDEMLDLKALEERAWREVERAAGDSPPPRSGPASGSSPASSDSTPGRSPSAN